MCDKFYIIFANLDMVLRLTLYILGNWSPCSWPQLIELNVIEELVYHSYSSIHFKCMLIWIHQGITFVMGIGVDIKNQLNPTDNLSRES